MEPAKIDWNNLDSKFVEDPLYEHINAPKWVDFLSPLHYADDHAWFCRSDCRHPNTVDDFRSSSKVLSSSDVFENIPLGEKKPHREATLKRRGLTQPSRVDPRFGEDCENQNPNFGAPYHHHHHHIAKPMKAFIKSSTEKNKAAEPIEEARSLKSTLSARNLFAGRDILNQINEFCKRFAREKETVNQSPVDPKRDVLERAPLLEVSVAKSGGMDKQNAKEKRIRNKRLDDITISLDLENVRRKGGDSIRTCPPSPQCFSATPPKTSTSKPMERGILEEVGQPKKKERAASREKGSTVEGRALDVFWFFKPCTLSS